MGSRFDSFKSFSKRFNSIRRNQRQSQAGNSVENNDEDNDEHNDENVHSNDNNIINNSSIFGPFTTDPLNNLTPLLHPPQPNRYFDCEMHDKENKQCPKELYTKWATPNQSHVSNESFGAPGPASSMDGNQHLGGNWNNPITDLTTSTPSNAIDLMTNTIQSGYLPWQNSSSSSTDFDSGPETLLAQYDAFNQGHNPGQPFHHQFHGPVAIPLPPVPSSLPQWPVPFAHPESVPHQGPSSQLMNQWESGITKPTLPAIPFPPLPMSHQGSGSQNAPSWPSPSNSNTAPGSHHFASWQAPTPSNSVPVAHYLPSCTASQSVVEKAIKSNAQNPSSLVDSGSSKNFCLNPFDISQFQGHMNDGDGVQSSPMWASSLEAITQYQQGMHDIMKHYVDMGLLPPKPANTNLTAGGSLLADETYAKQLQKLHKEQALGMDLSDKTFTQMQEEVDMKLALEIQEEEAAAWSLMQMDGNPAPKHPPTMPGSYPLEADLPPFHPESLTGHTPAGTSAELSDEMDIDSPGPSNQPSSSDISNEDEDEKETDIPDDEQTTTDHLKQYVRSLCNIPCAGCKRKVAPLKPEDVPGMTKKWAASTGNIVCGLPCTGSTFCSATTCPGCRAIMKKELISTVSPYVYHIKVADMEFSFYCCCEGGREFALWALVCGWDAPPSEKRFRPVKAVVDKFMPKSTTNPSSNAPAKPEYAPKYHSRLARFRNPVTAKGTGYGGHDYYSLAMPVHSRRRHAAGPILASKAIDIKEDLAQEAYFRLVATILPSHENAGTLDVKPPYYLRTMLARSPLLVRAADLLSNDAIEEVAKQYSLYDGMLDFVNALGAHTESAGLIYKERQIYSKRGTALAVSFVSKDKRAKVTAKDTGKSLTDLLSRLATQSRTMLQHAQRNEHEFGGKKESDMLSWAQRVVQISSLHTANKELSRADAMDIDSGKGKKPASSDWAEYHRDHALMEVPDDRIMHNHFHAAAAQTAADQVPPKGRMKRLITEISTLQTSLPEGIFVRHGSSRLDVMKILIIGPKGTPYEYGFFEFDLFCPITYPQSAPHIKFKTTGGGRVRFNPNLYEDGKVCLSLLGTWEGEPWRPEHSTLLQVLVSIQSMIFCETPWYNEPGRELHEDQSKSIQYSNDVRSWCIQHAVFPWVEAINAMEEHPEQAHGVSSAWREVAQFHLCLFGRDIDKASTAAARAANAQVNLGVAAQNIHLAQISRRDKDRPPQVMGSMGLPYRLKKSQSNPRVKLAPPPPPPPTTPNDNEFKDEQPPPQDLQQLKKKGRTRDRLKDKVKRLLK
ncbi:hypothetical protein BJ170DRAFT_686356 [Xylariales sp. AK1849]|nr:hypothetical protein BJ170DRAFT_686356 [Xylariales sp. AK1849]